MKNELIIDGQKYMYLYRYEIAYKDVIELREYGVIKETPKGYWISLCEWDLISENNKKWVSKNGFKRFAYPTKHEAMVNFEKRTKKRIEYLKDDLYSCEIAIKKAKNMLIEEDKLVALHIHIKNKGKNCGLEQWSARLAHNQEAEKI